MPELKSLLMLLAVTVVAAGATWYIKDQIYHMHHVTDNVATTSTITIIDSEVETPIEESSIVVQPPAEPVVKPNPPVMPPPEKPVLAGACVVGGCSSQLCGEASEMDGMVTTCEYREEYACYQTAKCERQATGKCGWTETPELLQCIKNS
ncbi:hypothetical protein K2P47_01815 [Patescibacteria group bacterium]|nr:hypothetical protein [Patescibacteria group bacterium]